MKPTTTTGPRLCVLFVYAPASWGLRGTRLITKLRRDPAAARRLRAELERRGLLVSCLWV